MEIRKIMSTPVHSVGPDDQVMDAHRLMKEHGFRHLPVIEDDGQVVGVVSDRDVRDVLVPLDMGPDKETWVPVNTFVRQIMRADPTVISPGDTVQRVVQIMVSGGFNCAPVVENRQVIGIVTTVDMMKALGKILDYLER